jgi:hypothetical protein
MTTTTTTRQEVKESLATYEAHRNSHGDPFCTFCWSLLDAYQTIRENAGIAPGEAL